MIPPLESGLYTGTVDHARREPHHAFRYPIFLTYLDLDEVDEVLGAHPLWSTNRWAPVQFRRSDYLGDPATPLAEAVRDVVESETGHRPDGSVRMLAHLRTFWWLFNPITLYYCYDRQGSLTWIVAEVTSTPWKERRAYVVPAPEAAEGYLARKELHVSPFMAMDQTYLFRIPEPGERLSVRIDSFESGTRAFAATLRLRREEITSGSLRSILWRFPLQTLRVSLGIYSQALRLRRKGAQVHEHPDKERCGEPIRSAEPVRDARAA